MSTNLLKAIIMIVPLLVFLLSCAAPAIPTEIPSTSTPTVPPPTLTLVPTNPPIQPTLMSVPTKTPIPSTVSPTATFRLEETLVYVGSDRNLRLVRPDGSKKRMIDVEGEGFSRPVLSPDGRTIAFTCSSGICTVGVDGKNLRRLHASGIDPSWSPDGTKILFTYLETAASPSHVALVNADDTNLVVTKIVGGWPVWSSAANQIAYIGKGPNTNDPVGLYLVNADWTNQRFLTSVDGGYPSWSPDGTRIAYSCTGVKPPSICVVTMDGKVTPVPTSTGGGYGPTWSPDGSHIAFSGGGGNVMTKDGKDLHRVVDDMEYGPYWGYATAIDDVSVSTPSRATPSVATIQTDLAVIDLYASIPTRQPSQQSISTGTVHAIIKNLGPGTLTNVYIPVTCTSKVYGRTTTDSSNITKGGGVQAIHLAPGQSLDYNTPIYINDGGGWWEMSCRITYADDPNPNNDVYTKRLP